MKKKLVTGALLCAFGAVAVTGGTLAYFTDTDAETNTFTTGNVAIDLEETFVQNSKLLPTTGKDAQGNVKNAVKKEVWVKNTGTEDAYVRVHIAIPDILDDGAETFDASKNVLHFNYAPESVGAGLWDWSKANDDGKYEGNWNSYPETINGVDYNVYVVTYGTALKSGAETAQYAMNQVYLDSEVTNEDVTKINAALKEVGGINIKVVAEGTQAAGFDDAYTALNKAFGIPGEYDVDWSGAGVEEQA